ncbi:aldo/keto reductase [Streptomyces pseudovenezuelae]|uniref:Aryl-alcohol dehydrogenase-like predicted oxidoreductase n=1 Tax=Streptomyces pseudovenezuelae TaxID=67350 RepID=A0ABT6LDK6_9ACTN|nr:aldo/keto reductase [Streptomyces pseudovenezuelae]MDH6214363.1 aryl-alcohol dehydrogenase-like predicted oxidoreductase [Streptomyces pseudovenezuelae]
MRTTALGSKGPEVGVVGLGCMGMSYGYDMSTQRDEDASVAVIHQALDLGMTFLDTADVYGPYTNEQLIGRALRGHRDRAVLATKVGMVHHGSDASPRPMPNGSPDHIRRSVDESLRRLDTDHVDLYYLHRVDPEVPIEESVGALAEAVSAGKARHIGLSEVTVEQIERAQSVHPITAVQSELSLWTRDWTREVLPHCQEQGIAFVPYSPLGKGFLTGRFTSFDELPQDDFRRGLARFQQDALRQNLALADKVKQIAGRIGATPAQVALAWVLAQGEHVIPIPGTKTPKYLHDNAGAADVELTSADLAELDALPVPTGGRYF